MPVIEVSSSSDPRLADYAGLRDRDLRRRDEGLFVGEQLLIVERMLATPGVVRSVLCAEPFRPRVEPLVPAEVPLLVGPMSLLESITGFHVHRGVLAIGDRSALHHPTLVELAGPSPAPRLLLACEGITHADNMGALFRVAAALGVHGVLLSPTCHDPLYRRCVRMSVGHVLTVSWRVAQRWPEELRELQEFHGLTCVGAAPGAGAMDHDDFVRTAQPSSLRRVLLVVGTEFSGLTARTSAVCSALLRIPMAPGVDSLNVAVAAAILLDRLRAR